MGLREVALQRFAQLPVARKVCLFPSLGMQGAGTWIAGLLANKDASSPW